VEFEEKLRSEPRCSERYIEGAPEISTKKYARYVDFRGFVWNHIIVELREWQELQFEAGLALA